MTRILLTAIVAAALVIALAHVAWAAIVPVAPAGELPSQGLRLTINELGNPAANDAISFYSSPPDVMMVSNLYPISREVCDRRAGRRTLPADPGDYCMVLEREEYKFTLSQITGTTIEVRLADGTGAGGGGGPSSSTPPAEETTPSSAEHYIPPSQESAPPAVDVEGGMGGPSIITPTTRLTAFSLSLVITIGCLALAALIVGWLQ